MRLFRFVSRIALAYSPITDQASTIPNADSSAEINSWLLRNEPYARDDEMRGGCIAGPDDEWGFPSMWFGKVREAAIMAHEVFGVGDHNPAAPARQMTLEEFERYGRWTESYQRRLRDGPKARFGPPPGETWLPDPNAPSPPRRPPAAEDEILDWRGCLRRPLLEMSLDFVAFRSGTVGDRRG